MELNIKEIRQKLNLTQAELAQMVGTSIQTISNWERLGNIPTPMRSKLENLFSEKSQKRDATDHVGRILDQMEAERATMAADRQFYQSQLQQERDRYDRLFALFEQLQSKL